MRSDLQVASSLHASSGAQVLSGLRVLSGFCVIAAALVVTVCIWQLRKWTKDRHRAHEERTAVVRACEVVTGELLSGAHISAQLPTELQGVLSGEIWAILRRRGCAVVPIVRSVAAGQRALIEAAQHVDIELAGIRATVVILALLPAGGMVLGYACGAHPVRTLLHGWGSVCLLAGVICEAVGLWWIRRMIAQARQEMPGVGAAQFLPLLTALLKAGFSVREAVHALPVEHAELPSQVQELCTLAHRRGAPIAAQLSQIEEDLRSERRTATDSAVAELGVRLARPLGLCFLPAFMLIGLVPLIWELGGTFLVIH